LDVKELGPLMQQQVIGDESKPHRAGSESARKDQLEARIPGGKRNSFTPVLSAGGGAFGEHLLIGHGKSSGGREPVESFEKKLWTNPIDAISSQLPPYRHFSSIRPQQYNAQSPVYDPSTGETNNVGVITAQNGVKQTQVVTKGNYWRR
jgi:hypothetical protein